jgi:hypothetical protein
MVKSSQLGRGEPGRRAPEIQIDKGIPLPPQRRRPMKYPWRTLKVGESFFVPERTAAEFSGNVRSAKKKTGHRYTTRTVDGGVRVWRLPDDDDG